MLGWIEKVVPQPRVISSTPVVVVEKAAKPELKKKESKSGRARKKPLEGKSSQPSRGKKAAVVTPGPASTTESSGRGVLTWLSEGLGKVVPQPLQQQGTVLQQNAKTSDAANQTEAPNVENEVNQETTVPSQVEGELQPSSDIQAPETPGGRTVFNRLIEEFEKMIPQPENVKPTEEGTLEKPTADQGNTKGVPEKGSSPTCVDSHSGLSGSLFPQTLGGDGGSMFKRFMHGLEKAIPQPASKAKPEEQTVEAGGPDPGQERSIGA